MQTLMEIEIRCERDVRVLQNKLWIFCTKMRNIFAYIQVILFITVDSTIRDEMSMIFIMVAYINLGE